MSFDSQLEAEGIAQTVAYPPPPWTLNGTWIWSIHPVKRRQVRSMLPAPLVPLYVPTGRTLAFSLVSQYSSGSTLRYSEAACGLILKLGLRPAIWISGLVVDSAESVAGGRNIWHLPKEMARIVWTTSNRDRVSVDQQGTLLLSFEGIPTQIQGLQTSFACDVLVVEAGNVRRIPVKFTGRLGVSRKIRPFFPASGEWSAFGVSGYSICGLAHGTAQFADFAE